MWVFLIGGAFGASACTVARRLCSLLARRPKRYGTFSHRLASRREYVGRGHRHVIPVGSS